MSYYPSPFSEPFRTWRERIKGISLTTAFFAGMIVLLLALCIVFLLAADRFRRLTNPAYPFPYGTEILSHWTDEDKNYTSYCYRLRLQPDDKVALRKAGTQWHEDWVPPGQWTFDQEFVSEVLTGESSSRSPFSRCVSSDLRNVRGLAWTGPLENFDLVIFEQSDGDIVYAAIY